MLFSQWIVCRAFKKLGKRELKLFQASSDVDIPHFITDFPELSQGHYILWPETHRFFCMHEYMKTLTI